MNETQVLQALAALAQASRLQIFRRLVQAGPQGLTPGDLASQLQLPGATLSFHLKELMHAQLIDQQRRGRHLIYRVSFEQMDGVLAYLTENCCQGQPCLEESLSCPCETT